MEILDHPGEPSIITIVLERGLEELEEVRGRGTIETERIEPMHLENGGRGHKPMNSHGH